MITQNPGEYTFVVSGGCSRVAQSPIKDTDGRLRMNLTTVTGEPMIWIRRRVRLERRSGRFVEGTNLVLTGHKPVHCEFFCELPNHGFLFTGLIGCYATPLFIASSRRTLGLAICRRSGNPGFLGRGGVVFLAAPAPWPG